MKKGKFMVLFCAACLTLVLWGMWSIPSNAKSKDSQVETVTEDMGSLLKKVKSSDIKKLIAFANEQIDKGNWETKEGIDRAIKEGEKEFNITLTKEEKEGIHSVVNKIKKLKLSPEFVLEQAEKIYDKYGKELTENATKAGDQLLEDTKDKIQEEVKKSVKDYFSQMVGKVKIFFKGFFGN
ncbi:MAG: DUF1002 domain-containing protein [Lachnospiraceae bacterium]|nr:DUF1002 domain-containing protein [Lachnospiraceae bacterium]